MQHQFLTNYLLEAYPLEVIGHWELEEGPPYYSSGTFWREASEPVSNLSLAPVDGRRRAKKAEKKRDQPALVAQERREEQAKEEGVLREEQGSNQAEEQRVLQGEEQGNLPQDKGGEVSKKKRAIPRKRKGEAKRVCFEDEGRRELQEA